MRARVVLAAVTGLTCAAGSPAQEVDRLFANGFDLFVHPGILLGDAQLDDVKARIAAGEAPWADAFQRLNASHFTSLSHVANPAALLTRADSSADDFISDAIAAYGDALVYRYSGSTAHADKAIAIMNAWAQTLVSVDSSAQLNAAWGSEMLPRAAEIIRYSYQPPSGSAALDVAGLSQLFTDVLLPQLSPDSPGAIYSNGNWELSMADATLNIGVFTENLAAFEQGLAMWRARVPAYLYASSDGPLPVPPPGGAYDSPAELTCFWLGSGTVTTDCTVPPGFAFLPGMAQETCRDMSHVVFGLGAMTYAAETARLQGRDLYSEQQQRILDGIEFAAKYDLQALDHLSPDGSTGSVDAEVCGGTLNVGGSGYTLGWEAAYNALAVRRGLSMPYTGQMIARVRPTAAALHMAWETLTLSAGVP